MDGFEVLRELAHGPDTMGMQVVLLIGRPADVHPYPTIGRFCDFFQGDVNVALCAMKCVDPDQLGAALVGLILGPETAATDT